METKSLNIIYAVSFIDLLGAGIIVPLQSTHLRNLNASHTVIGVIGAVYSGTQVLSGPLVGGWSDIQDRKYVLKLTILFCAVLYGCLGLTHLIFVIILVRFLLGVFKHIQSICKAVISDLVPYKNHTNTFGKTAALGSLGFTLGPFIGGQLSEFEHGFSYCCCLVMILFLCNTVLVSHLPNIPKKNNKKYSGNLENTLSFSTVMNGVKNEFTKAVGQLREIDWSIHANGFLLRFLYCVTTSCFFSNQTLFLREVHNLSQKHIGYILSFFGIIGMISAYFLNYINSFYKDDSDCYKKISHFFCIMTLCIFGFYIVPSIYLFMVLLVPFSLSSTMLRVVTMEILLKKSGETHAGSLSGASNSIMSVGRFVTLILSGILGDIFNEKSVILLSMLPAVLGVYISMQIIRSNCAKNKRE